jgi:hypothetical protein
MHSVQKEGVNFQEHLTRSTCAASPMCVAEILLMLQASMLNTVFARLPLLENLEVRLSVLCDACCSMQLASAWTLMI